MSDFNFDEFNTNHLKRLEQEGKEPLEHILFDTRLLSRVAAGERCRFFEFPIGTEQDGRIKTDAITNMDFAYRLCAGQSFLVNRIVIVADVIPLCSVTFQMGNKQYESGHIEHFHQKIGYAGRELKMWRQIPGLVNFWIDLTFDREAVAQKVYEIRAELHGLLFRPVC